MAENRTLGVVIVDDEAPARALLASYAGLRSELRVLGEAGDGHFAVDLIRKHAPDLVLLDIEMPGLDGFSVLDQLVQSGTAMPRVIFVTAFDRYAVRAFEINATDYLLKPVSRPRFNQAIDRCLSSEPMTEPGRRVQHLLEDALHLPPHRLLVRDRGRIIPVPLADIDRLESEGDYVRIHVGPRSHLVERTMARMEVLLASRGFVRVHRSAMVHLDRVRELYPEGSGRLRLRLLDGTELIVSRSYSTRFRKELL